MFQNWQDAVLSSCGTFFCAALLPAVLNKYSRIPRKTSVPTAVGLALVAITYSTLGLMTATVVQAVCAGLWTYLAICRPAGSVQSVPRRDGWMDQLVEDGQFERRKKAAPPAELRG